VTDDFIARQYFSYVGYDKPSAAGCLSIFFHPEPKLPFWQIRWQTLAKVAVFGALAHHFAFSKDEKKPAFPYENVGKPVLSHYAMYVRGAGAGIESAMITQPISQNTIKNTIIGEKVLRYHSTWSGCW